MQRRQGELWWEQTGMHTAVLSYFDQGVVHRVLTHESPEPVCMDGLNALLREMLRDRLDRFTDSLNPKKIA